LQACAHRKNETSIIVASKTDNLFVAFQRIIPTRLLGRLVYRLSRSRKTLLKNALIHLFLKMYPVDTTEMDEDSPGDYSSFNAFFSRALRPGARPVDPGHDTVCSPADGTVQQIGYLKNGQLLQVKGVEYSLVDLLGIPESGLPAFDAGAFLTIYLAPHNYHRVHMPRDASITRMNYVPGRRLAVNQATARAVPGLFSGNERLACDCLEGSRPYWLVFVGAMNVASISTAWAGEVLPCADRGRRARSIAVDPRADLKKGDYCGHFNMGSTVIVIFPNDAVHWDTTFHAGSPLRVGQKVGSLSR
jgi:phosphatidylserine decarboxylase